MSAQRDGGVITITGATDLRDGALLGYELRHKDMNFDPETPIDMLFQEGRMTVADGQYRVTVDIRNFEPEKLKSGWRFKWTLSTARYNSQTASLLNLASAVNCSKDPT